MCQSKKTPTYTITQFRKEYPSDAVCLDKIFHLRYGKMEACSECGVVDKFRRITTRRSYQCKHCYHQIYPTAGTVFEKTTTPLTSWFYVMYLMTATRNGVAAKEVERQLGVTYKTAWRMCKHVRILMTEGFNQGMLKGYVEADVAWVGGKTANKHKNSRGKKTGPQGAQTPVLGMVSRKGDVKAFAIPQTTKDYVYPIMGFNVSTESKLSTDEGHEFGGLSKLGFEHGTIRHSMEEYRKDWICTNTIEGYWSQLKRTIKGTHIHVSKGYLQLYINECSFRYNHRKIQHRMFTRLLLNVARG